MGPLFHRNEYTPDKGIQTQAKSKSRFPFDACQPLENQCATFEIFTLWGETLLTNSFTFSAHNQKPTSR